MAVISPMPNPPLMLGVDEIEAPEHSDYFPVEERNR
jgi:hypothetical protein